VFTITPHSKTSSVQNYNNRISNTDSGTNTNNNTISITSK